MRRSSSGARNGVVPRSIWISLLAALVGSAIPTPTEAAEKNIYYILDASGSMWGQMQGTTKIDIAKTILVDRLPSWKLHDVNIGLVAYGHRRKGDCQDIERLAELRPLNEEELIGKIEEIVPKGKTPIAGAVDFVIQDLRAKEEESHIILISDGKETCHADPCSAVQALKDLGIEFTLDVIGFDIEEDERAQLECIAEAGGGRYFPAESSNELHEALQLAEETEPVVKVAQNVQIILDRSTDMSKLFQGRSKFETATDHLQSKLSGPAANVENLSLRTFGGSCESSTNTQLDIPFGVGNAELIADRIHTLRLEGNPTLAAALKATIRDFSDPRRFEGAAKRVVVITGSRGHCDPMLGREVYELFNNAKIQPEVHLIAMDPPRDHIQDLERMVGATGGYMYAVKDEAELARAMDRIFDMLPVLTGVQAITEMLNGVVNHLNDAMRLVEDANYGGTEASLNDGRRLLVRTKGQFDDLGARQTRERFNQLYELADQNRQLQNKGFQIVEGLMAARRADQLNAYNGLIGEWNEAIRKYNANIREIDGILRSL